jgi:hypothetical protein
MKNRQSPTPALLPCKIFITTRTEIETGWPILSRFLRKELANLTHENRATRRWPR